MSEVRNFVGGVMFMVFIAGKVTGAFAAWSWLWVFLPVVPVVAKVLGWA